jgi:hypothetical protein
MARATAAWQRQKEMTVHVSNPLFGNYSNAILDRELKV